MGDAATDARRREIAEPLREFADALDQDRGHGKSYVTILMREAADELDRLLALLKEHDERPGLKPLDTAGVLWVAAIDRVPIAERIEWVKKIEAQVESINAERETSQARPSGGEPW